MLNALSDEYGPGTYRVPVVRRSYLIVFKVAHRRMIELGVLAFEGVRYSKAWWYILDVLIRA